MSFRHWRQFRWGYLTALVIAGAGIAVFQNCSGSATSLSVPGGVNALLVNEPAPALFTLNEVSYMSCPMVGSASTSSGVLPSPFYRIRVGAYDNSTANGFVNPNYLLNQNQQYPSASVPAPDNVGGIGISASAMNYIRGKSATTSWTTLQNYLTTSPFSSSSQPVVVFLNQSRDANPNDTNGLSNSAIGQQVLRPLADPTFSQLLAQASQTKGNSWNGLSASLPAGYFGTKPSGYFPTMPTGTNSLVATLTPTAGSGSPVLDELNFRGLLATEYVFAGFAPSASGAASSMIQNLQNPANTTTGAGNLFGYGYKININANPANAGEILPSGNGNVPIQEFDLNPTGTTQPTDLTAQNAEGWDCFSLVVVRDIDRKYWTAAQQIPSTPSPYLTSLLGTAVNMAFQPGDVIHPADVAGSLGAANPALSMSYIHDGLTTAVPTTNDIPYLMYNLESGYTTAALAASNNAATRMYGPTFNGNVASVYTIGLGMGGPANANSTGVPSSGGTYYACPPEDPSGQTGAVSTLTAAQRQLNAERLRVARRFLAADYWEINMTAQCAVPTDAAESLGSCYSSGDATQASYIQYNGQFYSKTSVNNTCDTTFLPNATAATSYPECPAKVSFCWRYH
jgi:hypothetical protein